MNEQRAKLAGWRRLVLIAGPGLVAMLADTDAGSIITVAQSGAQWGYRLLLPNLILIPLMFIAQEVGLRLALGAGQGVGLLVLRWFGRFPAALLLICLGLSCFGGLISQMSGLAGVAQSFGVPVRATMAVTVAGLILIVATGSYRSVERVALFFGVFELAFLVMAWRAAPGIGSIISEAAQIPMADPSYLYLVAANLGTGIIPWVLLYQPAASVDKGLAVGDVNAARLETLAGVLLCQTITSALLIAAAATLGKGGPLHTVGQIGDAFTATLGPTTGQLVFALGLSGSALVAIIVLCLTFAWTIGEVLGVDRSLEHHPWRAPWFYGSLGAMLVTAGAVVASGTNLVSISVAAGVLNALVLPPILGFLFLLARRVLPEPLRLRGAYARVVGGAFAIVAGAGVYCGIAGLF